MAKTRERKQRIKEIELAIAMVIIIATGLLGIMNILPVSAPTSNQSNLYSSQSVNNSSNYLATSSSYNTSSSPVTSSIPFTSQ